MNDTTFIYGLFDPRDCRLRYIGKSNNPQKRLKEHISSAIRGRKTHKDDWVRLLLLDDLEPSVEILEEVLIDNWEQSEKAWIAECKKFGLEITNLTDGGKISRLAIESRRKISDKLKGHPVPDGVRQKIRLSKLGTVPSEETRKKISEGNKGKKLSEAHIQILREKNTGKKHTEETKAKLRDITSNRNLGWKPSEETKDKIRQKAIGRKHSEETKKKLSERKFTEEQKQRMGESKRGNKNLLGYKFSEESKQKMRLAKLGKKQTLEAIENRVKKLKGHTTSEETRKKISQSLMGHPMSEETKQKIRETKRSNKNAKNI